MMRVITLSHKHEISKARHYVGACEDAVKNALHCDGETFKRAALELWRAKLRLAELEKQK
jgi:hypothetical protein